MSEAMMKIYVVFPLSSQGFHCGKDVFKISVIWEAQTSSKETNQGGSRECFKIQTRSGLDSSL